MDIEKFWAVIEGARQASNGNLEKQVKLMIEALTHLSANEIQEFDRILWTMMARVYRADLWEAVLLVACICSDDNFHEFQGWLIAQGHTNFEKVLENPEYLADLVDKEHRFDIFDGRVTAIGEDAYELKTNQEIPESGYGEDVILVGGPLKTEEQIRQKFPYIIAKLGECDDNEVYRLLTR
jgi:hypothetical protein